MTELPKLTVQEIIDILEKNDISESSFGYGDISAPKDYKFSSELQAKVDAYNEAQKAFTTHPEYRNCRYSEMEKYSQEFQDLYASYSNNPYPYKETVEEFLYGVGIGPIDEVDQYGGEGEGDTWYSVKYFPAHDVYIRIDGFYSSGNGTEFVDGYGYQVFPKEKTITVYEA